MSTKQNIPVHIVPKEKMIEEKQAKLRIYEQRYEMSSEKMATLMELDAMRPTAEVLIWYQTYYGLLSLQGKTPTTGTPGITTKPSTKEGSTNIPS